MFRVTENPSSGNLVQCLGKNYRNDSIVSVNMDNVMATYCDPLCMYYVVDCIGRHMSMSTETIESFL